MILLDQIHVMPPHWANDTIRPFDEDLFREGLPFVSRRYWCDSASVNVFRIVGTTHEFYWNKPWLWMLEKAQRISSNLREYEKNSDYYLQTGKKNDLSYITMNGLDYYIREGNHRSTIARFDFHYRGLTTLHGVTVEDVRIDREMFRLYREVVALVEEGTLAGFVVPFSEKVSREDTAGWMLETFRTGLRIRSKGSEWLLDDVEKAREWVRERTERRL